ncbi:MAG: YbhB/YbcL family Raf kinase inhibitor-like protein [Alphaproteobacteria bacterium]
MSLHLESPAFGQGEPIPRKYSCEGENISPPLRWSGVPPGTEELLLVCDDPDAPGGVFHHWAVYNIPADSTGLAEGFGPESLVNGLHQAVNDFGKPGYAGPCPPPGGGDHHYHFRLSALSERIVSAGSSATCVEVMTLARPHVLEFVELIGIFRR